MNLFPEAIVNLLSVSMIVSIIVMTFIQKLKTFCFVRKEWHIGLCNLLCSFLFGIPFSYLFYQIPIEKGIWVSLFSFIGAPSLYKMFKNQNLINFELTSLPDASEESNASENSNLSK